MHFETNWCRWMIGLEWGQINYDKIGRCDRWFIIRCGPWSLWTETEHQI